MKRRDPPPPAPPSKAYELTATAITYIKPTTHSVFSPARLFNPSAVAPTHILHRVSLTARPSQILAVVGPSGAGKSTLLDILAARTSPTSGSLSLNHAPITPSAYRKLSAYVPQHDSRLPLLTVAENFAFAATLLLPETTSGIRSAVAALLAELRLTHAANTRLSSGLSGGELRRVSIGLCLLRRPAVLILDEPTSGLDSASALNVMQTLKSVAASARRTVVVSVHQPSFRILSTIDAVLLLSGGRAVHHGTLCSLNAFLENRGFAVSPQINALEYAMEILTQLNPNPDSDPDPDPPPLPESGPPASLRLDHEGRRRCSRGHEIVTLCGRFWKIIYRTRQLLLTNTLEAVVVGLVLGSIYIDVGLDKAGIAKRSGLFAFTLTFLLSSTTETLPIFIGERPVLIREASDGTYRLSSYLAASTLLFLPYLLAVAAVYSGTVYFLAGLCATWGAFAYFVVVIWAVVLMANSLVLFLSAVAPNYISGASVVAAVLAAFFLFSGYFIPVGRLPRYWVLMHLMSVYKYALEALVINEYSCIGGRCLVWYEEGRTCLVSGGDVLRSRGLHEGQRWSKVYALVGFFLLYRLLWLLVLSRRVSRCRK